METVGENRRDIRLLAGDSAEARNSTATGNTIPDMVRRSASLAIDHVVIAADDLDAAARALEAEHGLVSTAGGRHPDWGTANRIVPLGAAYLELVAVVDETTAGSSALGSWVAGASAGVLQPLGWAVRTDELDDAALRLGLTAAPGSRLREDGQTLRWRLAGVERAAEEPALPFLIEWEPGTPLPGSNRVVHRYGNVELARLELRGDAERLAIWLGPHRLPITVSPGAPAVTRIVLRGPSGEVVIDGSLSP
jgi:hypothetical protein